MTNFGNFGPILMKLGGKSNLFYQYSIIQYLKWAKILSLRNSVVDPYTVHILFTTYHFAIKIKDKDIRQIDIQQGVNYLRKLIF